MKAVWRRGEMAQVKVAFAQFDGLVVAAAATVQWAARTAWRFSTWKDPDHDSAVLPAGKLLAALAASKPGGRLSEAGRGCGANIGLKTMRLRSTSPTRAADNSGECVT